MKNKESEFTLKIVTEKDAETFMKIWKLITQYGIYHSDGREILDLIAKNGYIDGLLEELKTAGEAQVNGILNDAVRNNYVELAKAIFELDNEFRIYSGPIDDAKRLGYHEILQLLKEKGII